MQVTLYHNLARAREIVGSTVSGTTIAVSEQPDEVRQFDSSAPNGALIEGWTYNDGIVTLPSAAGGDITVAISNGTYVFAVRHMYLGLDGYDYSEDTLVIKDDTYDLINLVVELAGPNYTSPVVKWINESGEHDFPYTLDRLPAGQELLLQVKVYLGDETFGNYRDVWFKISAFRADSN